MSLLNKKKYEEEIECLKAQKREACCALATCQEELAACGGATVSLGGMGVFIGPTYRYPFDAFDQGNGSTVINFTGESAGGIGHLMIPGGGSKTLSAAGGGKIFWANSLATFATAPSTFRIGIQGVNPTTGVDDGVFSVYGQLVAGTNTIASNAVIGTPMTTGSVSLTHGSLIAIVAEFTTRAGGDSINVQTLVGSGELPYITRDSGAGPQKNDDRPMFIIQFDDGTLGTLSGLPVFQYSTTSPATFNSTTTPDEYAMVFTAPMSGNITAVSLGLSAAGNDANPELVIYADPTGTPTALYTRPIPTDTTSFQAGYITTVVLETPLPIVAGSQYAIAMRATTAVSLNIGSMSFGAGNGILRRALMLGDTLYMGTRTDATGPFTLVDTRVLATGFYMDSVFT